MLSIKQEQSRLEKAQAILDTIRFAYIRIKTRKESINGFPGTFRELREKYQRDIETTTAAIERLEKYY